ncbi:hypothetical protein ACFXPZ_36740 [Streptomyces sp. NPDC059101]|uniref:hypothetical protein n=1 Tax=unclassified Streptomyces TaxID=2593676 RepID=UPI000C27B9BB|nr:hypothetical protein [Streptomyces sp. CB02959]PJN37227.1 hypothetical protein CG747_28350 [Streptomyces sp. CB02959]
MGSLRNPIGPLPSSIYWRRRAIALAVFVLLAALVVWALTMGGSDEKTANEGKGAQGSGPAASITPGPTPSGPVISQKPGGRDESDAGGASGGGSGSGAAGGTGSGGGSGGSGGGSGAGGAGSGGTPIGQAAGGDTVAAGPSLPNCGPGTVKLALKSGKNSYAPDDKPKFELTVQNSGGTACKVDLGRKATVLSITDTAGDDRVWASDDCATGAGPALLQVPAKGAVTRTVEWDRRASGPQCATPSAAAVPAGTYLIEAKVPGLAAVHTSFVLAKD